MSTHHLVAAGTTLKRVEGKSVRVESVAAPQAYSRLKEQAGKER